MRRLFSSQAAQKASSIVLDGAGLSKIWQSELAKEAAEVRQKLGRPPGLAVVIVGERPDSQLYVQRKQEACARVGIASSLKRLKANSSQAELEAVVRHLCSLDTVDGLLVQLPLPGHFNEEAVIDAFEPSKDVDGFHPLNVGCALATTANQVPVTARSIIGVWGDLVFPGHLIRSDGNLIDWRSLIPCTALGCMELLTRSNIDLRGKEAVLMGDSNVVGTPLAMLLRDSGIAALTLCSRPSMQALLRDRDNGRARAFAEVCLPRLPGPASPNSSPISSAPPAASVSVNDGSRQSNVHASRESESFDLPEITRRADILVVAVGSPELVTADWIKPGAVVLDVGINVVNGQHGQHRVVGDCAFEDVSQGLSEAISTKNAVLASGIKLFKVASAVTPVPGGVGPMTIAAVLHNTIQAAWIHAGEQHEPSCHFAAGSV